MGGTVGFFIFLIINQFFYDFLEKDIPFFLFLPLVATSGHTGQQKFSTSRYSGFDSVMITIAAIISVLIAILMYLIFFKMEFLMGLLR